MEAIQQKASEKTRNPALDVIRIVALLLVITTHFFFNQGYFGHYPLEGKAMFVGTIVGMFSRICVPLFLIISGYLLCHKKVEKRYYLRIIKIIAVYLLAALACLAVKQYLSHTPIDPMKWLQQILNFTASYGWYINMYIGLFLLIPFLNIMYNNISKKSHKLILIASLIFLTGFPMLSQYLPSWWNGIYPITYYFIGCYIREYQPKIKKSINIILLVLFMLISGGIRFFMRHGQTMMSGTESNKFGDIIFIIPTILVFIFLLGINYSKLKTRTMSILSFFSSLCLGAYLSSWIFDNLFYKKLTTIVPNPATRLLTLPIMVIIIAICSFIVSFIIDQIYTHLAASSRKLFCNKPKTS